jgi:hypothetical protein
VLDVDLREPHEGRRVPAPPTGRAVSSARYVVGLAWRRITRRGSGALLTALGLTVAAAVLAGVLAGVTIAADRATAQAVERIPAADRSIRAVWFGIPAGRDEELQQLDADVRSALGGARASSPTRLVLFRESTVAGRFVGLSAVDGLAEHVIVRSGRLPRACEPARCEVLRLRGRGRLPDAPGLRLVEVGTATLVSQQLFGDFLAPTDQATADAVIAPALQESGRYHRPAPPPLVVAEGVAGLSASPQLERTYRSYAWTWPLGPDDPRLWEVDGLIGEVERARSDLAGVSSSFQVDAPDEELRAAERRANVAGRRLLLVGGEVAALLLAFALLAARGMRRDLDAALTRLTWNGARRWQLALLTVVESALVAVAGIAVGWLLGSAAGALAAGFSGAPAGDVLRESVLSPTGLALALGAAFATGGLVVLAVSMRVRRGVRFGALEGIAAAALLVLGIALLGGAVDDEQLARAESSALLVLVLPGLVAVVAAIAVARLFPVLARAVAERSRVSLTARLATLGLARSPGAAVVTVAFLTIAFGLALLAESYRSTLERGEREQAAFQVPLDVAVREDLGTLVRVFDAAPLERFRSVAGAGGEALPVLRVGASAGRAEQVTGVTVLGLDPEAIERLGVWRPEWADGRGRRAVAAAVAPASDATLEGAVLDDGVLDLQAGPTLVSFVAVVETPNGAFRRVELDATRADRSSQQTARVAPGARVVALEVVPPPRLIEGGADAGIGYAGSVRLGGALGRAARDWVGVDGATVTTADGGVDVRFVLTRQRTTRLRARQPTDESPPQVLVTGRLAEVAGGLGGSLPLQVSGAVVPVRIAGVVERFPGTTGDVVVGDRGALRTAINAASPGAARENEAWLALGTSPGDALDALTRPPFRALRVTARSELEAEARRDPLARGTLVDLGASALLALVLAALGLALAVRADLRDDGGELLDLEAQGASPSLLRRVVRGRALVVALAGLVAGVVTGILLLGLVTRVVAVTARGGFAEPPLVATVDLAVVAVGVACFAALAVLLVGMSTRRAFAEPRGPLVRRES